MPLKIIKNPKTGKMETVEDRFPPPSQAELAKQRKELRDMLDGNVQFHTDPFSAPTTTDPKKEQIASEQEDPDAWYYHYLP